MKICESRDHLNRGDYVEKLAGLPPFYIMTLLEFKSMTGVDKFQFYKSKTTSRLVAEVRPNVLLVTTKDFNASQPAFVYDNPVAEEGAGYILSNKEQRAADLVL